MTAAVIDVLTGVRDRIAGQDALWKQDRSEKEYADCTCVALAIIEETAETELRGEALRAVVKVLGREDESEFEGAFWVVARWNDSDGVELPEAVAVLNAAIDSLK